MKRLPFRASDAGSFAVRAGLPLVSALRRFIPDLEELLTERGIEVDHVTLFRWMRGGTLAMSVAWAKTQLIASRTHTMPTVDRSE